MRYLFAALVVALGIALFALTFSIVNQREPDAAYGVPFALVDQDGAPITEAAFRGQPTALFFGFTHCPEICPTTLYELDGWFAQLGEEGADIDAYFVTIDPERDTPESLKTYLSSFDPRITGLTGSPEQVAAAVKAYRGYARKVPDKDGGYTMEHTALVYVMGRDNRFVSSLNLQRPPEESAAELAKRL